MTTTESRLSEFGAFIQTKFKIFSSGFVLSQAPTYDTWRKHLIQKRLNLGFSLALLSYFTFSASEINNFFFDPEHF